MIEKIKLFIENEQVIKWSKNTLVFFAPALIIFFTALVNGTPLKQALIAIYVWLLNVTIDALKKINK